ncbi:MAG: type II CAAX prenyl endopeptidase Rce1 family protein [Christensenellales bacterium]|jgi:membrane protease YdiL (CAAX protease family)
MDKVKILVRQKPMPAFLALTFLISWAVWGLSPFVAGGEDIKRILDTLGAFGPALAALAISAAAVTDTRRRVSPKYWLVLAALFIAALTVNILSLETVLSIQGRPAVYILLGIMALLSAVLLAGLLSRNGGVRKLLGPFTRWKTGLRWYFAALLLFPCAQLLGTLIDVLLGAQFDFAFYAGPPHRFIYRFVIGFAAMLLFGGALNEEPGWRGFALPRLLGKYSPLTASIILGFVWSLWHAPLHFNGFYADGLAGFLTRFIWNIPLSVLFTWIYTKTRGSLIHVTLLHTGVNTTGLLIPVMPRAGMIMVGILVVILAVVIISDRMWVKTREDFSCRGQDGG